MITAIYGDKNGTQDSIAWWISEEENCGPQIYQAPWRTGKVSATFDNPLLGTMVEDIRSIEEHVETLRLMENVPGDFIQPMRVFEKDYKMLIWSNYFGAMCNPKQVIEADKVILCNESKLEDCFHYIISHAFKKLSKSKIDDDTEVWWMDHVYVGGENLGIWKEIWYNKYHEQTYSDFENGKLVYMWQLNYMHWDLYHAIENGHDQINMVDKDDFDRLFCEKLQNDYDSINQTIEYNPSALVVTDPTWWSQADDILNFLNMKKTESLQTNLKDYITAYSEKRKWFDQEFKSLISKYA